MDFLSHKKELTRTESAHIIIFFSFETTPQPVTEQKKETPTRKKKRVILYLLRALVLQRRRETREMPGNPPPLTRLLLPCWQDVMLHLGTDSLRECQREILNRAGFPT